jgi:hypothetical protein
MKTTLPYEFLARFRDGRLAGCHAQFIDVFRDDDNNNVIAEKLGPALPVAVAESAGFPLDQILGDLHKGALAEIEHGRAALAVHRSAASEQETTFRVAQSTVMAERDQLKDQLGTARTEIERLSAKLADAQAQIVALRNPPAPSRIIRP